MRSIYSETGRCLKRDFWWIVGVPKDSKNEVKWWFIINVYNTKYNEWNIFLEKQGFDFFFLEFFWPVALGRFQKILFCVVSRKDFFNKKCRGVIWLKIKATSTRMLCGSGLIHQWRTAHLSAQQKLASPPHTTHPPTSPTKQVSNHFTNLFIQKYLEYYEG